MNLIKYKVNSKMSSSRISELNLQLKSNYTFHVLDNTEDITLNDKNILLKEGKLRVINGDENQELFLLLTSNHLICCRLSYIWKSQLTFDMSIPLNRIIIK